MSTVMVIATKTPIKCFKTKNRLTAAWATAVAGCWAAARSLCMQAVGGGLSGLAAQFSDESALEVFIHVMRHTNQHLYLF